jgi:hypothetical protein
MLECWKWMARCMEEWTHTFVGLYQSYLFISIYIDTATYVNVFKCTKNHHEFVQERFIFHPLDSVKPCELLADCLLLLLRLSARPIACFLKKMSRTSASLVFPDFFFLLVYYHSEQFRLRHSWYVIIPFLSCWLDSALLPNILVGNMIFSCFSHSLP